MAAAGSVEGPSTSRCGHDTAADFGLAGVWREFGGHQGEQAMVGFDGHIGWPFICLRWQVRHVGVRVVAWRAGGSVQWWGVLRVPVGGLFAWLTRDVFSGLANMFFGWGSRQCSNLRSGWVVFRRLVCSRLANYLFCFGACWCLPL